MSEVGHYVYVIAKRERGAITSPVKVGISADPHLRLGGIQTSCPFKIELAWIFQMPNREFAEKLERCFHETQAAHCAYGEWFNFEPVRAIHLLCVAYRTLLQFHQVKPDKHDEILDIAGVLWAEKRFGLATPPAGEAMQ